MDNDDIDQTVDDILQQLSDSKTNCNNSAKLKEYTKITPDNLQEFVIEKSADLVQRALDIVDDLKDRACASGDPEEVKSLADVLKATSAAVDALNKIHIASERNKTAKEINEKTIQARQGMNRENNQTKLMCTREEAMKRLFNKVKEEDIVDVEVVEDHSNLISTASSALSAPESRDGRTPSDTDSGERSPMLTSGNSKPKDSAVAVPSVVLVEPTNLVVDDIPPGS
jgi:hypothetical protein